MVILIYIINSLAAGQADNPQLYKESLGNQIKENVVEYLEELKNEKGLSDQQNEEEEDEDDDEAPEEEYVPVFVTPEDKDQWKLRPIDEKQKDEDLEKEIDTKITKMKLSPVEKKFVKKFWFNFDLDASSNIKDKIIQVRKAITEIGFAKNSEESEAILEKYQKLDILRDKPPTYKEREFNFLQEVLSKEDDTSFHVEMVKKYMGTDEKGKTPLDYAKNEEEKVAIREQAYFESIFGKELTHEELDMIEDKVNEMFSEVEVDKGFNIIQYEEEINKYMIDTYGEPFLKNKNHSDLIKIDDRDEEPVPIEYSLYEPEKKHITVEDQELMEMVNMVEIMSEQLALKKSQGKSKEEYINICLEEWINGQETIRNLVRHDTLSKNIPDYERFFNVQQKRDFIYERLNGIQIEKNLQTKIDIFVERYLTEIENEIDDKFPIEESMPLMNNMITEIAENIEFMLENNPEQEINLTTSKIVEEYDQIMNFMKSNRKAFANPEKFDENVDKIFDFIYNFFKTSEKVDETDEEDESEDNYIDHMDFQILRQDENMQNTIENYLKESEALNSRFLINDVEVDPYSTRDEKLFFQLNKFIEMEMTKKKIIDSYRYGNGPEMTLSQILQTENYIPKEKIIPKDYYDLYKISEKEFADKIGPVLEDIENNENSSLSLKEEEKEILKSFEILTRNRIYRTDGSYYYHSNLTPSERDLSKNLSSFMSYDILLKQIDVPDYYTKEQRLCLNNRIYEMNHGLLNNSLKALNSESLYISTIAHPLRNGHFNNVKNNHFQTFISLYGHQKESDILYLKNKIEIPERYKNLQEYFSTSSSYECYLQFEYILFNEIYKNLNSIRTPIILQVTDSVLDYLILDKTNEIIKPLSSTKLRHEFNSKIKSLIHNSDKKQSKLIIRQFKNFSSTLVSHLELSTIKQDTELTDEIVFEDKSDEYFIIQNSNSENSSLFSVLEENSLLKSNKKIIENFRDQQNEKFDIIRENLKKNQEKEVQTFISEINNASLPEEKITDYFKNAMGEYIESVGKIDKYSHTPITRMVTEIVVDNFRSYNKIRNLDDLHPKNIRDILELFILRKHPKIEKIFTDAGISTKLIDELAVNSPNSEFVENILLKSEELDLPIIKELVKKFHNISKSKLFQYKLNI